MRTVSTPLTAKLPVSLLEEAATWYVQLKDTTATEHDRQHWQQWLDSDERHQQAWQQMQTLQHRLQHIPGELAAPTLQHLAAQRRQTIKLLTVLLATGAASWAGYEVLPWRGLTADYHTAAGERQRITLVDGGTLDINTRTRVDVRYNTDLRLLRLHAGEILIQTAPDAANRPFEVHSPHGIVRALGTRFSVASDEIATRVIVFQDTVQITIAGTTPTRLHAGEQMIFTKASFNPVTTMPADADAWINGKLIVNDTPLSSLVEQLAPYRPGYLLCDPAIADLRVSGTFRLDDTDGILANLEASLPVRVRYVTRYWARIEAQAERA